MADLSGSQDENLLSALYVGPLFSHFGFATWDWWLTSEVIHALERKGLIKRNPHPNHRRTLPATLTAKGRRVLAACEYAVAELESTMLEGFSDSDREEFLAMIKAGVRNLGGGFPHD